MGQLSENVPQSGGPGGITVHARVSVSLLLRENRAVHGAAVWSTDLALEETEVVHGSFP